MDTKQIREKIITILEGNILGTKITDKEDKLELGETGLGMDSLTFLKFLTEIEKSFGVKIEDDYWDIESLSTVEDIVNYLSAVI